MQKQLGVFIVIIVFQFCRFVSGEDAKPPSQLSEGEIDKQTYEKYKNQVCKQVPAFSGGDGDAGPKWSDIMDDSEILELAFVNQAYGLSSDAISYLKEELGWKKSILDIISLITKATCRDDVIAEAYLNTAKNLFLYYMVKQSRGGGPSNMTEGHTNEWNEILNSLIICSENIESIDFTTDCGMATSYTGKDGAKYPIIISNERLDDEILESASAGGEMGLDVVVDTVWWMFSTTYARCYSFFYPNEDVILLFFQMFRDDILNSFLNRWRSAGGVTMHFPIVFGPYDFDSSAANTRKCCSASYQYENLEQRQLVRPVTVLQDNIVVRNYKT